MTDSARTPSAIDKVAEDWVDTLVDISPSLGTYIGRNEVNDRYGDLSPQGHERYADEARKALGALDALEPTDHIDVVTKADLSSDLRLGLELHDAKWHLRDLNVIASAPQDVRAVYDLMPTATPDDWSVISRRLGALPAALDGYTASLREGIAQGVVPARRQVAEVATQIARYTDENGFFAELAANASPSEGQLPASLARELADNAGAARVAYDELAAFLTSELAPAANEKDAVGRELYALNSRRFLGATIDLDETYDWGVEELSRMVAEQESIADEIKAGASVEDAVALLEADPSRKLHGTKALQEWMQATSDRAIEELGRTHFDIPEKIR
ncbi:MAG TPA: DUF885 domain-containing protein, partial [Microbacterium sp.]|nr:DUF885 domain-containing protein [Microbacterium sp.]